MRKMNGYTVYIAQDLPKISNWLDLKSLLWYYRFPSINHKRNLTDQNNIDMNESMDSEGPVIVCYHYPCIDGIFSALAAHLSLGSTVSFFPLTVYKQHLASELNLNVRHSSYLWPLPIFKNSNF